MESPDRISPTELKRLIITLKDHSSNARIRFRLIGSMWENNFFEIVHATTENVIVQDRKSDQMNLFPLEMSLSLKSNNDSKTSNLYTTIKLQTLDVDAAPASTS